MYFGATQGKIGGFERQGTSPVYAVRDVKTILKSDPHTQALIEIFKCTFRRRKH